MRAPTTAGLDSHSLDHGTTVAGICAITRPGAVGRRCRLCPTVCTNGSDPNVNELGADEGEYMLALVGAVISLPD